MPKSTNKNAPNSEYSDGIPAKGAVFRASITYDEAIVKLEYPKIQQKLTTVLTAKKPKGKPFNSNPWSAYSGIGGKEYDLDGGQVWRVMRSQGCWFLAKHVGGFNQFEFWHISDPPGKTKTLESINNPGSSVQVSIQSVTTSTPLPSHTTKESVPVITTEVIPDRVVPDSWDDDEP